MFFSFDGIDGVGKSTQIELFRSWLEQQGHDVLVCRDPGSTPLGDRLREIVLDNKATISATSEMLIYMASRAQMVEEIIRPALDAGKTVVSDRYLLATIVYQGHAGGVRLDNIRDVGRVATQAISPDMTFLLDMTVDLAMSRIQRSLDRMESRGSEFLEKVRQGFLQEAASNPDQITVIDASQDVTSIQQQIRNVAQQILAAKD